MATAAPTFSSIKSDLRKGVVAPIYLLHGEEGFYLDQLVKEFESLVPDDVKDFNLYTLYAPQTVPATVVDVCQRYPMMSERQVVIVKECQAAGATFLNNLAAYAGQPSPTTVLVLLCRGEQARGAELLKQIRASKGVIFESKKLYERSIATALSDFASEFGLNIDQRAAAMMTEYIGADLSRLYNEISKLSVVLGKGATVTPEAIERNIGISKDYNMFELQDALVSRNFSRVMTISDYFRKNPKNNPVQPVLAYLFKFFSNLLVAYYAADKTDRGIMEALGFKSPYQVKGIRAGMAAYKPWQLIEIIGCLRRADAQSKGIGSRANPYDIFQDAMFLILTCSGNVKV